MSVLRRAKLRTPDGIESIEYPLGVDAENVEVANSENLSQRLARIDEDLEKNEEDIAAVSELAGTNKQNIGANEIRIDALERRSASVDKKIYYFNTIAEMKSANLKENDVCQTLGYYEVNDGGTGLYKIVDDDTLIDDGGSIHELDNGLNAQLIIKDDSINIRQFGAKGDNSTDDTIAIQNALKFRENKYLKVIFNENDTYLMQKEVYLYSNTDIELNNCTIKDKYSGGATDSYVQFGNGLRFLNNIESLKIAGYGALKNITIRNGILDGNKSGMLFGLIHAENIKFENIYFKDCSVGTHIMDLGGCRNIVIEKCDFSGSYIIDSNNYREMIQPDFATYTSVPYWGNDESYAFDDLPCENISIDKCNFEKGNGTHYPNAIGSHSYIGTEIHNNIKITNCIFYDFTYANIRFPKVQNLIIEDNIFYNNEVSYSNDRSVINLNSIGDTQQNKKVDNHITIRNNKFYSNMEERSSIGIEIYGYSDLEASEISISNNYFESTYLKTSGNPGSDFVHIGNADNVSINNNIIKYARNSIYKVINSQLGLLRVENNEFINCKDIIRCNSADSVVYPRLYVVNNNTWTQDNNSVNDTRFCEELRLNGDIELSESSPRVPFTKLVSGNTDMFPISSDYALILNSNFVKRVKISGCVRIYVNEAHFVSFKIGFWDGQSDHNLCWVANDLEKGFHTIQLPTVHYDIKNLFDAQKIYVYVQTGSTLHAGDKLYENGTILDVAGF